MTIGAIFGKKALFLSPRDQIVILWCICTAVFHILCSLGSSDSLVQEEETVRCSR